MYVLFSKCSGRNGENAPLQRQPFGLGEFGQLLTN